MFYYFVQLTKYFNILLNILLGHQNLECYIHSIKHILKSLSCHVQFPLMISRDIKVQMLFSAPWQKN